MKKLDEIQKRIKWERFYDPGFNWFFSDIYSDTDIVTDEFIEEFKDKIYWGLLLEARVFPETFLVKYQDHLDWDSVSKYQVLTEDFIHLWRNKLNWDFICAYQQMSETFLLEHSEYIEWEIARKHQCSLSKEFIVEYDNAMREAFSWLYEDDEEMFEEL